jgi:glycosyltransferase involved in cell wall biosynthesis
MRILFAGYHGSVHTRRWAGFFAARGDEVHVVTCGDRAAENGPAYAVHDLGPPRPGKPGYLAKVRPARRLISSLRPDVVHAHYATSYGLLGLASGFHPLVVSAHGDDVLISPGNPVMRALVTRVLRSADAITVPGDHVRVAVEGLLGGATCEVHSFQYGVETVRLAALARELRGVDATASSLRIVSVRPLLDLYRIDLLLAALAELRRRGVDYSCDVVGEGGARARLEGLRDELGLSDRVRFRGQLPGQAVERIVGSAHVYVSLADSDGTSLGLLEALALGAVPVLSDIPANRPWVRNGETGVLAGSDSSAVADAIQQARELSSGDAPARNQRLVSERGDREANLSAWARSLERLVNDG